MFVVNICYYRNRTYIRLGQQVDIYSLYSVKIKQHNSIFKESLHIYRLAVDFFIDVCLKEWDSFSAIASVQKKYIKTMEQLTVPSPRHRDVKYDFNASFYKTPCYLRRAAISEAVGKVSSYMSNISNWENADPRTRGEKPSMPKAGFCYPVLYRGNMFVRIDDYTAQIKVFRSNTWNWITVKLRKSDVDYISRNCSHLHECAPTLQKRGRQWYLDFPFQEKCTLKDTPIRNQIIVAVDLGINNACTCSILTSDGAVLGRHFLKLSKEYDCLKHKIDHIKRAQRHGSYRISNLWAYAKGVNDDIAVKTAQFIIDTAIMYDADCIVLEHLDLDKKKRGFGKQKLALWKAKYVHEMVTHKAHVIGMHVSHINAWGTSRLAYDNSGKVLRGMEADLGSYSVCKFSNGKIYNCDLNASYNIGSRYFVRELLKTLPATERQRIEAKVPGCAKRSTCTLATLISLNGELQTAV